MKKFFFLVSFLVGIYLQNITQKESSHIKSTINATNNQKNDIIQNKINKTQNQSNVGGSINKTHQKIYNNTKKITNKNNTQNDIKQLSNKEHLNNTKQIKNNTKINKTQEQNVNKSINISKGKGKKENIDIKNVNKLKNNTQQNKSQPNKSQQNLVNKSTQNETIENKVDSNKNFNLTETLINFFSELFSTKNRTEDNKTSVEKNQKKDKKKEEEEKKAKELKNREDAKIKAEKIKIDKKKKEEKKEHIERENFDKFLENTSFREYTQIALEKGGSEILYLDIEKTVKIKLALLSTDDEGRINFLFSGPKSKSKVLSRLDNKNYLFYENNSLKKGEYTIEIKNRSNREIEIIFMINENVDKKFDNLDIDKLDKISSMLNNIDNNINQLRNKKKIEIRQVNNHNDKVNSNNKSIIFYSCIEIFTLLIIFGCQSYYMNSLVNKL